MFWLCRLRKAKYLNKWNSVSMPSKNFQSNEIQFKTRTKIDIKNLMLDDVGYDYRKVTTLPESYYFDVFIFGH
jgi:hypothetical protein